MTCYSPLKGWRSRTTNASGKRSIVFQRSAAYTDQPMEIPCGQCIGCRLERSRQWAIRCTHEASLHDANSFITLTYDDENIPEDGSLDITHFQKFMKRLRKSLTQKIRFYACGEYGEKYGRPHYHACVFGHDFPDKTLWKTSNDIPLYRSASLEALWPLGYSSIGQVTFQSAAYVARYLLKKVTGDASALHYEYINPETGEIHQRRPEYTNMSRRDGIGKQWFKIFISDVYPSDEVIMNQKQMRPPKYYDGLYELTEPEDYKKIKRLRKKAAKHPEDQTTERLKVREAVQKSKLTHLPRKIE